jgi:hypothetical protein
LIIRICFVIVVENQAHAMRDDQRCSHLVAVVVVLGQQARDALLLLMQLSSRNDSIANYIVEHTNFCPVNIHHVSIQY